jgi:3-oxoacyl-ACP reductase-like protein
MKITVTNWGMLYDYTSGVDLCRALYFIDNQNLQKHLVLKKPESKKFVTAYEAVEKELKRKYGDSIEIIFDEKKAVIMG